MPIALSFEVEASGPLLPERVTDREAMVQIGLGLRVIIVRRTQNGTDAQGRAFAPYSTRRIYIPRGKGTGQRLTPKGGVVTASGKSVRYDGGYAEYKRLSRGPGVMPKGGASGAPTSEVDLLLSEQLMRSIGVAQADADSVVVQTGPGTAAYAAGVNDRREFMGLAPSDYDVFEAVVEEAVTQALRRMGYA